MLNYQWVSTINHSEIGVINHLSDFVATGAPRIVLSEMIFVYKRQQVYYYETSWVGKTSDVNVALDSPPVLLVLYKVVPHS